MASLVYNEPALAPKVWLTSQLCYDPALAPRAVPSPKTFHDVWASNLDEEFSVLMSAVAKAGGSEAILALDMEFPGFPCKDPRDSSHAAHYQALRSNIDQLWPIQLGIAVVGANGIHHGIWTFNLHFDANVDTHTEESLVFLRRAGIDFPRHRNEGIAALALGRRIASSSLVVGAHGCSPSWVTFSGSYDWGYLLKLVTLGRPLPGVATTFNKVLSVYCPKRRELRDLLPHGSLEVLGHKYGVKRCGSAHTAGSDALLTVELFMLLGGPNLDMNEATLGEQGEQEEWVGVIWNDAEEWRVESADQWCPEAHYRYDLTQNGVHMPSLPWETSTWAYQNQDHNTWFSPPASPFKLSSKSPVWYPSRF